MCSKHGLYCGARGAQSNMHFPAIRNNTNDYKSIIKSITKHFANSVAYKKLSKNKETKYITNTSTKLCQDQDKKYSSFKVLIDAALKNTDKQNTSLSKSCNVEVSNCIGGFSYENNKILRFNSDLDDDENNNNKSTGKYN